MKKKILSLSALITLTFGGFVAVNSFNLVPNEITVHAEHAGLPLQGAHGVVSFKYTPDYGYNDPKSGQTVKFSSQAQVNKALNSAPARNESDPSKNIGFNIDSNNFIWYRNYSTNEDKDTIAHSFQEFFTLFNKEKTDPKLIKYDNESKKLFKQIQRLKKQKASKTKINKLQNKLNKLYSQLEKYVQSIEN